MTDVRLRRLVFQNLSALLTLALIVVHQTVIASSVYFLAKVVEHIGDENQRLLYLILFMGSMIFPFVPGCLSLVMMQRWVNVVHAKIVTHLAAAARDRIELLRCSTRKEAFESAVSRNSFGAVTGFITLTHDFCSLLLNSIFSMAVIGFLLPKELLLGYGISLVAALLLVRLFNVPAQRQTSRMEGRYSDYGNCLSRAWSNTVVGNQHNYEIWLREQENTGRLYYRGMLGLSALKQSGNVTIALASLFPSAYLIFTIAADGSASPTVLAVVVANLTRIFHILNSLGALVYQMLEWSAMKARLSYLFMVKDTLEDAPVLPDVPVGAITINGSPVSNFEPVINALGREEHGRFTVRGANGSGKSTLLIALKKAYAKSAFFLPTTVSELNWGNDYRNRSTGQRMRAVLEEVCSAGKGLKYLLLDEWDANLDGANRDELDRLLTRVSQRFVVVEVRH